MADEKREFDEMKVLFLFVFGVVFSTTPVVMLVLSYLGTANVCSQEGCTWVELNPLVWVIGGLMWFIGNLFLWRIGDIYKNHCIDLEERILQLEAERVVPRTSEG